MPAIHWDCWDETRARWSKEGMPLYAKDMGDQYPSRNEYDYFNAVPLWARIIIKSDLYPPFEKELIEETNEYRIFRSSQGVIQQEWKHKSGIPHFIDFTFKGAKDWDEYKKRLQPDRGRIPEDLDTQIAEAENSGLPISITTCSMMGWIRNWMGVANMSYLMYDAQDVYADMVDTIAELACWGIDQIVPKMKQKPDIVHGWEDICGKSGPLVSPHIFEKCVAPGYLKMRRKLEEYDIKLLSVDSDGDVEQLAGYWLESGVNVLFPMEIGTWNADPMKYRKKFGKELRIIGGINKLELEKGPADIDAEIERRIPLMKNGGFLPVPDHYITPDTSLENYKYYLKRIRKLRL